MTEAQPLSNAARVTTVLLALAFMLCLPLWAALGLLLQIGFVIGAPLLVLAALLGPATRRLLHARRSA